MKNHTEHHVKINVNGFLNRNTEKLFSKKMSAVHLHKNDQLILELSDLVMEDQRALSTLANLHEKVRKKGAVLILKNISASVYMLLNITQTLNYFNIENEEYRYAKNVA